MRQKFLGRDAIGKKRVFYLDNKNIQLEIFWHHGKNKIGAEVYLYGSGKWGLTYSDNLKELMRETRVMIAELKDPAIAEVNKRMGVGREYRSSGWTP